MHIGEFRNKANNKRKRRVLYFAIIVFKHAEDCQLALNEPRHFQSKVNKLCKKTAKFSLNPLEGESEEEEEVDEHTKMMEEGGFILVAPEKEGAKKGKGTDGINTVQGIS